MLSVWAAKRLYDFFVCTVYIVIIRILKDFLFIQKQMYFFFVCFFLFLFGHCKFIYQFQPVLLSDFV